MAKNIQSVLAELGVKVTKREGLLLVAAKHPGWTNERLAKVAGYSNAASLSEPGLNAYLRLARSWGHSLKGAPVRVMGEVYDDGTVETATDSKGQRFQRRRPRPVKSD